MSSKNPIFVLYLGFLLFSHEFMVIALIVRHIDAPVTRKAVQGGMSSSALANPKIHIVDNFLV